jgi:hypothetical protein
MMNEHDEPQNAVETPPEDTDERPRPKPIRGRDIVDTVMDIGRDTKNGVLEPVYDQGWRWLNAMRDSARSFVRGALTDKDKK